jgi:hypothetical protein
MAESDARGQSGGDTARPERPSRWPWIMGAAIVLTVASGFLVVQLRATSLRELLSTQFFADLWANAQDDPFTFRVTVAGSGWASAPELRRDITAHLRKRGFPEVVWTAGQHPAEAIGAPHEDGWIHAVVEYDGVECTIELRDLGNGASEVRLGAPRTIHVRRFERALDPALLPPGVTVRRD